MPKHRKIVLSYEPEHCAQTTQEFLSHSQAWGRSCEFNTLCVCAANHECAKVRTDSYVLCEIKSLLGHETAGRCTTHRNQHKHIWRRSGTWANDAGIKERCLSISGGPNDYILCFTSYLFTIRSMQFTKNKQYLGNGLYLVCLCVGQ